MGAARHIAELSAPVVAMAKETVHVATETSLAEGLRFEKRQFWATFALHDREEGMVAFKEKRAPAWKHR